MSELVQLVNEWDRFEKEHPQSTIEDFCRHYLIMKRQREKTGDDFLRGHTPPDADATLAKTIGRLGSIMLFYLKTAFRDEKEIELEWAFFLNALYIRGESRKTDVINYNFAEQSTGIDILNRLKNLGLITERDDPDDKRAKLVKVTPKGEEKVWGFWERSHKNGMVLFDELQEDDKKLIIQLLMPIEEKHTRQLPEMRNKSINEIMDYYLGKEKAAVKLAEIKKRQEFHRKKRIKK